jgi:tetraacyldisaccharide 4'-kinase
VADRRAVERIWFGEGMFSSLARSVLLPSEVLFRSVVAARNALYDRGVLAVHAPGVPTLGIGNLTVGGTGKTPMSSWAAEELVRRGARPAIVLRGYGADEVAVHAHLTPGVPVIASPDRVAGARDAVMRGADVVVLDDAFQHRRIARQVDWVLLSADGWTARQRMLPAGPWRETLRALRRASIAVVTRKAAAGDRVATVVREVGRAAPRLPIAVVHLAPDDLRSAAHAQERQPLSALDGAHVLLISGVGDPAALEGQIRAAGARVRSRTFADHHAFSAADVTALADDAHNDELVVCTLKDAVKIAPQWPRAAPALWYVSQRVIVEEGMDHLSGSLDSLLRAPSLGTDAAGPRRPFL